jgi:hypothetical protein
MFYCGDNLLRKKYMRYIPSSSNRVAPLANEEIKQMTRSKIWNNRGKDMFMMLSFIIVGNKWKKMKSVFECYKDILRIKK